MERKVSKEMSAGNISQSHHSMHRGLKAQYMIGQDLFVRTLLYSCEHGHD